MDGSSVAQAVLIGIAPLVVVALVQRCFAFCSSPWRHLPGPTPKYPLLGHTLSLATIFEDNLKWMQDYGSTIKLNKPFFGGHSILTTDLKTIQHVCNQTDIYHKPSFARFLLYPLVGEGIFLAEGEQHRRQRRVLNPAFSPAQIREFVPIFNEEAQKLRDELDAACKQGVAVNMASYLASATMQIIGRTGFNYDFRAQSKQLSSSLFAVFKSTTGIGRNFISFQAVFPPLRIIPTWNRAIAKARAELQRVGRELITAAREEAGKDSNGLLASAHRDLLSILIRSNLAIDLPERQRLSEAEVVAQVPSFIVAGSETTSTTVAWAIYAMCLHRNVQDKLRNELHTLRTEDPSMDELNSLPYLDCVVRETLRVHAPVALSSRVAVSDDVIPLAEPVTDSCGKIHEQLRIRKGSEVLINILGVNTNPKIWGPDSGEFKPERWEVDVPLGSHAIPGVWGNMLSFLGGPHACIGYRFSILETKAILYAIIRSFTFELAVAPDRIFRRPGLVQRPSVKYDKEGGNKLPVYIKPYVASL